MPDASYNYSEPSADQQAEFESIRAAFQKTVYNTPAIDTVELGLMSAEEIERVVGHKAFGFAALDKIYLLETLSSYFCEAAAHEMLHIALFYQTGDSDNDHINAAFGSIPFDLCDDLETANK